MKKGANIHLIEARKDRQWSQQELAQRIGTTQHNVSRWERGVTTPGPYFRAKLCEVLGRRADELAFMHVDTQQNTDQIALEGDQTPFVTTDMPTIWSVPYARNPHFTGRIEILHTLHEQLNQQCNMALTQSRAISGLGGIGKTQIALEYAYQYRQNYRYVFWISAASYETLFAGFVHIADLLQLPTKDEQNQKKVFMSVKHWLNTHQHWLLILDNADDVTVLQDVVPTECAGHLLLTTRAQALGTLAQRVEVETMGMAEGTLFLLRRAKLLALDALLHNALEEHLASTEAIAIEMDFLPLALDQAGAYIEEVGCDVADYLELYQTYRAELLQRRGNVVTAHADSVTTTLLLSFQQVEAINPGAADLLRLCAFLDPDAIPEELICEGNMFLGPVLQQVATNRLLFNAAIEELRKFSLVQRDPYTKSLRVHRLVQAVLKDTMENNIQRQWAERAVHATNKAFPEQIEITTWPLCRRFLAQSQACSALIQIYILIDQEASSLLYRTALYMQEHALYEHAELLYQQAIQISERNLGSEHPDVATMCNKLAVLYYKQGRYDQAEVFYQRARCIWEQAFGPNHVDVARALSNLALLYYAQGKYTKAEPMYQRAFAIETQMYEEDHPFLSNTLNNMAGLYEVLGKYVEAEQCLLRALSIRERKLGPEHPQTALVLNNLAGHYSDRGEYVKAEPMLLRAMAIYEQRFDPDHPDVARSFNTLADLYIMQREYKRAEAFATRALSIREQKLGMHPDTARSLDTLARLYEAQGNYPQADAFYQRALEIDVQILGAQHPETNAIRERYLSLLHLLERDGEENCNPG